MIIDYYYFILVLPALLFAMWAQGRVSSTYAKYSRVHASRRITAQEAARRILSDNGLDHVQIQRVNGNLTDHYDPGAKVVRLSDTVYNSDSVAALGVAAHECGHAIQHARGYAPLMLRNAIIPVTNFGSKLSIPLILLGLVLGYAPLVQIGIWMFALMAIFQLVTLPVEFNASARALATLERENYLEPSELRGSKRVLQAAALTYVAALLVTVMQLLRLVLLFGNRRRD